MLWITLCGSLCGPTHVVRIPKAYQEGFHRVLAGVFPLVALFLPFVMGDFWATGSLAAQTCGHRFFSGRLAGVLSTSEWITEWFPQLCGRAGPRYTVFEQVFVWQGGAAFIRFLHSVERSVDETEKRM
jgi:hypothetical protein